MSTEPDGPHYGCPECGSPKFHTTQDRTEYCTESITCTYTSSKEEEGPDFDIDDYGDVDTHDSESGDVNDEKECADCGHTYTEPTFYSDSTSLDQIAERSELNAADLGEFGWIFAKLAHTRGFTVRQEAHATIIEATPKTERRGETWAKDSWSVVHCCACSKDLENPHTTARQVYRESSGPSACPQKVEDSRGLPVILRAALCPACR